MRHCKAVLRAKSEVICVGIDYSTVCTKDHRQKDMSGQDCKSRQAMLHVRAGLNISLSLGIVGLFEIGD